MLLLGCYFINVRDTMIQICLIDVWLSLIDVFLMHVRHSEELPITYVKKYRQSGEVICPFMKSCHIKYYDAKRLIWQCWFIRWYTFIFIIYSYNIKALKNKEERFLSYFIQLSSYRMHIYLYGSPLNDFEWKKYLLKL